MAYAFNDDKSRASIRTVTVEGSASRPNRDEEVTVSFPIDKDEIVLALMCKSTLEQSWHYISAPDGSQVLDTASFRKAYHSLLDDNFYVTCFLIADGPTEIASMTVKAVVMKLD